MRYQPDAKTLIFGSYAWAKTKGSEPTRLDENGAMVDWQSLNDATPEHALALQARRRFGRGWSGALAVFHLDEMRWLGDGGPIDAYTRVDSKLGKRFRLSDAEVNIELIVQNLANAPYQEFRDDSVYKR